MNRRALDRFLSAQLETIVGSSTATALLPRLLKAVHSYKGTDAAVAALEAKERAQAIALAKALLAVERKAERLLRALDAVAAADKVAGFKSLGDIGRPMSAGAIPDARARIRELRNWAKRAASRIEKLRPGRRSGPKTGIRRQFAAWLKDELAKHDVKPTKSADGKFARVLNLAFECAGVEPPEDLYRDTRRAIGGGTRRTTNRRTKTF